jgi:glycine dehydrogenase subunit 1
MPIIMTVRLPVLTTASWLSPVPWERKKILVSADLHPHYFLSLKTYRRISTECRMNVKLPHHMMKSAGKLEEKIDMDTALVLVQYPVFLRQIQDFSELAKAVQ